MILQIPISIFFFLIKSYVSLKIYSVLEDKLDSMEFPAKDFPSGAVVAFALKECPSGWMVANGDKWEYPPVNISQHFVDGQEAHLPDLEGENRFIRAGSSDQVGK